MPGAMYAKTAGVWTKVFPPPAPYNDATGGTVTEFDEVILEGDTLVKTGRRMRAHTFTSTADLTILSNKRPFHTFLLGGGGSGGGTAGGGGGGGRAVEARDTVLPLGTLPFTIGGGGAATTLSDITAAPGGNGSPFDGGDGSGGASNFPGGSGIRASYAERGGGGGGAGGPGDNAGGAGGAGGYGATTTIRGLEERFGGGGGGGGARDTGAGGGRDGGGSGVQGGQGGGGAANTGGGGGGGGYNTSGPGGPGGSGIGIIAYEIEPPPPAPFHDATGGTITTFTVGGKTYRMHRFDASGTFELTAVAPDKPLRVLVAGGGGPGGNSGPYYTTGGNGGQGQVVEGTPVPSVGPVTVTVGGTSSFGGLTASGGGGGGSGWSNGVTGGNGDPGTSFPCIDSDIEGAVKSYCGGGGGGGAPAHCDGCQPNIGSPGGPGYVLAVYEIATPTMNDATGGTVTEVVNYNGSTETWRVHTLANGESLTVLANPQPFRTLVVAGGGAGYTNNINASGGGGGGEVLEATGPLPVGDYPAVVGQPGRWNGTSGNDAGPSSFNGVTARRGTNCSVNGGDGTSGNGNGPGGGIIAGGGGAGGPASGTNGGPGVTSDITGTSIMYGSGGGNTTRTNNPGDGGSALSMNGEGGTVIVAYRIG